MGGPATEKCKAATEEENAAIKEQKKANTDVEDKKKSLQTAKAEAASLEANCLCSAYMAQTEAKAAPAAWTKSQQSEWKRAHEILCAVDQKEEACVVPPFPAVELPEDVAGATDATHCVPFVDNFLKPLKRAIPLTRYGGQSKIPECNNNVQNPLALSVECNKAVGEEPKANFYRADPIRYVYAVLGNSIEDGTSECSLICTALDTKISTEWTALTHTGREPAWKRAAYHFPKGTTAAPTSRFLPICAASDGANWHRYEYGKMDDGTVATEDQIKGGTNKGYHGPKTKVNSGCELALRSCDCNGILKVNSEWKQ